MNKLRLIRYFALFIVFCAEYRCAPREAWPEQVLRFISEASRVEPREKMKVEIKNLSFERVGEIVKSYEHESLTLIVNEHSVQRTEGSSDESSSGTRVYQQFIIKSTNSDSISETIFSFWSVQIRKFVYFVRTGTKVKLILMAEFHKGIIVLDFLNPGDVQLFWNHTAKSRKRTRSHLIDILRFEIFNRETKEKMEDLPFAVIHRELCKNISVTYTISVESHGVTQTPLLIFSSGRFSVSEIIEDRVGLLVLDEPQIVFILQFSPFENYAVVSFLHEMSFRRSLNVDPISENELRAFID